MALLDDAAATARRIPYLAAVPALATVLAFEKLTKTATAGPGGGMKFPMPTALPDLWTFVSVPNTGVTFNLGVPFVLAPLFFVLNAALVAGYVGSIDAVLEDEQPDFVQSATANTVPILGIQLVVFALVLVTFGPAFVGGMALAPISALAALAVSYLLWSAPILVVVRDLDVSQALSASVTHATSGSQYATFSATYLVGGIVVSAVLSFLVRGRPVTLLLATLVLAYPLLVVSVATVTVVKSLPPAEAESTNRTQNGRETDST